MITLKRKQLSKILTGKKIIITAFVFSQNFRHFPVNHTKQANVEFTLKVWISLMNLISIIIRNDSY